MVSGSGEQDGPSLLTIPYLHGSVYHSLQKMLFRWLSFLPQTPYLASCMTPDPQPWPWILYLLTAKETPGQV